MTIKRNFCINTLSQAQRVIRKQSYYIRRSTGTKINEAGYKVTTFSELEKRYGSVQRVVTTQYKSIGLDLSKEYIQVYDVKYIQTLDRNNNADEIIWNGFIYHPIPNQEWFHITEWNSVLAVKVSKYDG